MAIFLNLNNLWGSVNPLTTQNLERNNTETSPTEIPINFLGMAGSAFVSTVLQECLKSTFWGGVAYYGANKIYQGIVHGEKWGGLGENLINMGYSVFNFGAGITSLFGAKKASSWLLRSTLGYAALTLSDVWEQASRTLLSQQNVNLSTILSTAQTRLSLHACSERLLMMGAMGLGGLAGRPLGARLRSQLDLDGVKLAPLTCSVQGDPDTGGKILPNNERARRFYEEWIRGENPAVTREGDSFVYTFRETGKQRVGDYSRVTDNMSPFQNGEAPGFMGFVGGWEPLRQATRPYLVNAPDWRVLHGAERIKRHGPLPLDKPWVVRMEVTDKRGMVILTRKVYDQEVLLQEATTILSFGGNLPDPATTKINNPIELGEIVSRKKITDQLIDDYMRVSGDGNVPHLGNLEAQSIGLPGRVFHGMGTSNLAESTLAIPGGPAQPWNYTNMDVRFSGMALVGDELIFYRRQTSKGWEVTAVKTIGDETHRVMDMSVRYPV